MDKKPPRGRGRPSRAEVSAKALADIENSTVDPLDVLRAVAADKSAPASARVAACRLLLAVAERERRERDADELLDPGPGLGPLAPGLS